MDNNNQADIASIGEELDEAFLFNDSGNSSVSSSVNSHSSEVKKRPKGFHKFWSRNHNHHTRDQLNKNHDNGTQELSQSVLPKFKCQISAPSTPINTTVASSWTYGVHVPLKHNSSFGSVDEEDELRPALDPEVQSPKRSKSRLSLNLVGKEKSASPRSPRKISKMIRSSFSRLLQLNNDNNERDDTTPPTPSEMPTRGPSMNSINSLMNNQEMDVMTPSTLAYLEEAKHSGLPVIPFQYPTCVLIGKIDIKYKLGCAF